LGNTELDFGISGSDLASEFDVIVVGSIKYTFFDNDYTSDLGGTLGYTTAITDVDLAPSGSSYRELSLGLTIPPGTSLGEYYGTLYLSGIGS